jgi:hypothetical protein
LWTACQAEHSDACASSSVLGSSSIMTNAAPEA